MSAPDTSPTIIEVLRFEDLPLGSRGTRRAIARWSDGTESEALTYYADEILICEGDLIGKTPSSCAPCTSAGTATGFSPSVPRRELASVPTAGDSARSIPKWASSRADAVAYLSSFAGAGAGRSVTLAYTATGLSGAQRSRRQSAPRSVPNDAADEVLHPTLSEKN